MVFLLPIYLQAGHGASPASAGLQLMPLTIGIVVGAMLNGRITERTQIATRMPPFGLSITALSLLALAWLPPRPWTQAASLGTAAFGGLAFTLLRITPQGPAETAAVSLGALAPEQIAQAFRIVFTVPAVFAAAGVWIALRVPALNIATGSSGDSPIGGTLRAGSTFRINTLPIRTRTPT